jgi:uncharacterized coiled-coil DUF342 family protein
MTEDIEQLNRELEQTRITLDEKSAEKERAYQKRQSIRSKISQLINEVKELKKERNTFTSKVRKLKETKSGKIAEQKGILDELKELQKKIRESQPAASPGKGKVHPDRLLQQIERLDYVIETEALSPKKEQEVMDKIRQLKTEYEQVKGSDDVYAKYREVRKQFTNLNREISEVKTIIQSNADTSQEHHVKMLEVSKQIDELKAELDAAEAEYQEKRTEYLAVLDGFKTIKEKLGMAVPEKRKVERENRKAQAEARAEAENTKLASKQEDVYAKIKKKQKITTEDLLILQNAEMRGIEHKEDAPEEAEDPQDDSEESQDRIA